MSRTFATSWMFVALACGGAEAPVLEDAATDATGPGDAVTSTDAVAYPECFLTQCDGAVVYCPPGTKCSMNGLSCSGCECYWSAYRRRYEMGCQGLCRYTCAGSDAAAE